MLLSNVVVKRRKLVLLWSLRIGVIAMALAMGGQAVAADIEDQAALVDASLVQVRAQIRDAEGERARYEGGLIVNQILLRLSILHSTEAMLEQKRLSLAHNIPIVWHDDVPACGLLAADQKRINQQADATKADVAAAEHDAALYSGGLIRSMALVRVATAQATLAMLDQQRMLLQSGMPLRLPPAQQEKSGISIAPGKTASDRDALQ